MNDLTTLSINRLVLFALLFILLAIATVWATILKQDTKRPSQEQPTIVTEGDLTEAQKKHGKLFQAEGRRKKLSSLPDGFTIYIPAEQPDTPTQSEINNSALKRSRFQSMVCDADLIIIAVPAKSTTQITEAGDFIFTDYELIVGDIIRDTSSTVRSRSIVTLTRPGGSVVLNGKRYRVLDQSFGRLEGGRTYLLFLKFNTHGSTYQAASKYGTFALNGDRFEPVANNTTPYWVQGLENSSSFIINLRSVAGSCPEGDVK